MPSPEAVALYFALLFAVCLAIIVYHVARGIVEALVLVYRYRKERANA